MGMPVTKLADRLALSEEATEWVGWVESVRWEGADSDDREDGLVEDREDDGKGDGREGRKEWRLEVTTEGR